MVTYVQLEERRSSSKSPRKKVHTLCLSCLPASECAVTFHIPVKAPQQTEASMQMLQQAAPDAADAGCAPDITHTDSKGFATLRPIGPCNWQASLKSTEASIGHAKPRSTHQHHVSRSVCILLLDMKVVAICDPVAFRLRQALLSSLLRQAYDAAVLSTKVCLASSLFRSSYA